MNACLNEEKVRISRKEDELRQRIMHLQQEKPLDQIQTQDISQIYETVHPEVKKVVLEADM